MSQQTFNTLRRNKRRYRIRKKIVDRSMRSHAAIAQTKGLRPRLTIFKSNYAVYLQLIDDNKGHTLAAADTRKKEGNKKEILLATVEELVEKAKKQKIQKIIFDRNIYRYHGIVKQVSELASQKGLQH